MKNIQLTKIVSLACLVIIGVFTQAVRATTLTLSKVTYYDKTLAMVLGQ